MKRVFLLLTAAAVLAGSFLGVSCVHPLEPWEKEQQEPEPEPDPDPNPTPTPGPTPTPTPKPVSSLRSAAYVYSDAASPLKRLELSSNGRYVVEMRNAGNGNAAIRTGTYGISGKSLILFGLGSATLETLSGKASGVIRCAGANPYTGEGVVRSPSTGAKAAEALFKGWTITKTRISVTEGIKINADLVGCDMDELARILKGLGVKVNESMAGIRIQDVVITWGTILFRRSDGYNYSATCKYDGYAENASFQFTLTDFIAGFSGGEGIGRVKFSGDLCLLTLEMEFARGEKKYKGSITFVLKPQEAVAPTALSIQTDQSRLPAGGTLHLVASVVPADAVCRSLSWVSSDPAVADVSDAGVVTAISAGTAKISVADAQGHSASCTVTVP